jgi:hypothetical protein
MLYSELEVKRRKCDTNLANEVSCVVICLTTSSLIKPEHLFWDLTTLDPLLQYCCSTNRPL